VFAVALAVLSYIDRVAISQAAGPISGDLGLTKSAMGLIFGAFGLSYSLFEVPSGWLGDWMGARKVLVRIVLWWSAFTALTGAAWNFASLWVVRFLFGAGEAGCFPNITKMFSVWLPFSERATAQGIMWASARWGGAFTPPLVVLAFHHMSWRAAFASFGALGLVWIAAFALWFRDRPSDHPAVNAGERALLREVSSMGELHAQVPWRRLIAHRSLWLLWAQYFCLSFGWYFYVTWLPTYLQEFRRQTPEAAAKLAIFPLLFGGFGCLASGFVSSRFPRSRRSIAVAGLLAASLLIALIPGISAPLAAMLVMGSASFANDLVVPASWHACMSIGGRYAGTVSGSMNMMGNLAAFVAPSFGGLLLDHTGNNWNLLLYVIALVYVAGALCWPFIDSNTPIDQQSGTQTSGAQTSDQKGGITA
jgi:MFS family permease